VSWPGYSDLDKKLKSSRLDGLDSRAGAAYVYMEGAHGWPTVPTVTLDDPAVPTGGYDFGTSVALSGTTMVVGADGTDSLAGATYIFVKGAHDTHGHPWCEGDDFRPVRQLRGRGAVSGIEQPMIHLCRHRARLPSTRAVGSDDKGNLRLEGHRSRGEEEVLSNRAESDGRDGDIHEGILDRAPAVGSTDCRRRRWGGQGSQIQRHRCSRRGC
jgi:hypothetical protein